MINKSINEFVILVDEHDQPIGAEEKLAAHRQGKLHRAFSIFIFNNKGELMLQQRAANKYHTSNLWTNTCCSHPRPGEDTLAAAHRRLQEEMGFDCQLKEMFSFSYKVHFPTDNLFEHEFDHVFFGTFDGEPILNPEEAQNYTWITLEALEQDMKQTPEKYTYWLKTCFDKVKNAIGYQIASLVNIHTRP